MEETGRTCTRCGQKENDHLKVTTAGKTVLMCPFLFRPIRGKGNRLPIEMRRRVVALLRDTDKSQQEVANEVGCTQQAVSRLKRNWEKGRLNGTGRIPSKAGRPARG